MIERKCLTLIGKRRRRTFRCTSKENVLSLCVLSEFSVDKVEPWNWKQRDDSLRWQSIVEFSGWISFVLSRFDSNFIDLEIDGEHFIALTLAFVDCRRRPRRICRFALCCYFSDWVRRAVFSANSVRLDLSIELDWPTWPNVPFALATKILHWNISVWSVVDSWRKSKRFYRFYRNIWTKAKVWSWLIRRSNSGATIRWEIWNFWFFIERVGWTSVGVRWKVCRKVCFIFIWICSTSNFPRCSTERIVRRWRKFTFCWSIVRRWAKWKSFRRSCSMCIC